MDGSKIPFKGNTSVAIAANDPTRRNEAAP